MENMKANSDVEGKITLNRFYNEFFIKELCFNHQEAHEIQEAVSEMVEHLVESIGHIDSRVRINEVIPVGSAAEGTRIILPNEFDFLLVLDAFSRPGAIRIARDCSNDEGHVHIIVQENDLLTQFEKIIKNNQLVFGQEGSLFVTQKYGLKDIFQTAAKKATSLVYFNEHKNLVFHNQKVGKMMGTLTLDHYTLGENGPAFNFSCTWHRRSDNKDMEISIDVCPVIRSNEPLYAVMKPEDTGCQKYYEYAEKCGSVMLMPCKKSNSCAEGQCFRLNFTEAELLLVKEMSFHHIKCYKILKYLINGIPSTPNPSTVFHKCLQIALNGVRRQVSLRANKMYSGLSFRHEPTTAFHSYALKLIVLNHHYKKLCTEEQCLASCIENMLHDILNILNPGRFTLFIGTLPKLFPEDVEIQLSSKDHSLENRIMILLETLNINSMDKYKYGSLNEGVTTMKQNQNGTLDCVVAMDEYKYVPLLGVTTFDENKYGTFQRVSTMDEYNYRSFDGGTTLDEHKYITLKGVITKDDCRFGTLEGVTSLDEYKSETLGGEIIQEHKYGTLEAVTIMNEYNYENFRIESVNCILPNQLGILFVVLVIILFGILNKVLMNNLLVNFVLYSLLEPITRWLQDVICSGMVLHGTTKTFKSIRRCWIRTKNFWWRLRTALISFLSLFVIRCSFASEYDNVVMTFEECLIFCVLQFSASEISKVFFDQAKYIYNIFYSKIFMVYQNSQNNRYRWIDKIS